MHIVEKPPTAPLTNAQCRLAVALAVFEGDDDPPDGDDGGGPALDDDEDEAAA
jgi:hypothetical protein